MVNRFKWHSAYAKREEKKEIINEHRIEVKNSVDIDKILQKAINKGLENLEEPKQVH
jgi:DNA-directed RNA polymerase subunit L